MRGGLVEGGGLKWECSIRRRGVGIYNKSAVFAQLSSYAC